MLDIRRIKKDKEQILKLMAKRGEKDFSLDEVIELDDKRIALLQEVEVLKNKQNTWAYAYYIRYNDDFDLRICMDNHGKNNRYAWSKVVYIKICEHTR